MVCEIISNIETFADLIIYPVICDHFFYGKIMVGLFIILTSVLYFKELEKYPKPDMISCLGTSSIVIIFLSMIGTLIKNTNNIPMISSDIFIYILAISIIFIGIWIFKSR
jgi:hypothetical protein